jgi:hypothetical protein
MVSWSACVGSAACPEQSAVRGPTSVSGTWCQGIRRSRACHRRNVACKEGCDLSVNLTQVVAGESEWIVEQLTGDAVDAGRQRRQRRTMPGCRHVGEHLAGPTGIAYRPGRETWARASGPSRRAPAPAAPSARPGKTAGSRRPPGTAATRVKMLARQRVCETILDDDQRQPLLSPSSGPPAASSDAAHACREVLGEVNDPGQVRVHRGRAARCRAAPARRLPGAASCGLAAPAAPVRGWGSRP